MAAKGQTMDFVTRIELRDAAVTDYARLDQAMMAANFSTEVVPANGVPYRMPEATYFSQSVTMTAKDVRDLAMRAASGIGLRYDIVTTSGEMAFFLHPAR